MSTVEKATDTILVNRGDTEFRTTVEAMSTLEDTDLLLVNRGGSDYRCTAADVKAAVGGGGLPGIDVGPGIMFPMSYPCPLRGVINFALDSSGWVYGQNGLTMGTLFNIKDSLLLSGGPTECSYRAPFGFVGSATVPNYFRYKMYSYAANAMVAVTAPDAATANLVSGYETIFNSDTWWYHETRFEAPLYQDGWWIFGADNYMHYEGTGGTIDEVIAATKRVDYGTLSAFVNNGFGNAFTNLSQNNFQCRGTQSSKGLLFAGGANVFIVHPHDTANPVTVLPLNTGARSGKFFIGEWLFAFTSNNWMRNATAGDYDSAFVPITMPANFSIAGEAPNILSVGKAAFVGDSGTLYMVVNGNQGRGYILSSLDNGLTWTEYHCLGPVNTTNIQNISAPPTIDPRKKILVHQKSSDMASGNVATGYTEFISLP